MITNINPQISYNPGYVSKSDPHMYIAVFKRVLQRGMLLVMTGTWHENVKTASRQRN